MIFDRFRKKSKEIKEPERNPYWGCDYVVLNKDIEHQGIGGKKGYIDRIVTIDDILERLLNYDVLAMNFAKRRPDLFRNFEDLSIPDDKLVKRKAKYKSMKYYYVKIWQQDGKNGTYLGYLVASDEYTEYVKANEREGRWI